MYKNKLLIQILMLLMILTAICTTVSGATWYIHKTYTLHANNTYLSGFTTNATSTAKGDWWVVDTLDQKVYHYWYNGTFKDSFLTSKIAQYDPREIWINKTVENDTGIYLITEELDRINIVNMTGGPIRNISISNPSLIYITGLTSNGSVTTNANYWVTNDANKMLYRLNATGNVSDSCSLAAYVSDSQSGLSTNSSNDTISQLWIADYGNDEIYNIDLNCKLLDTIDVGDLGIVYPVDVEPLYKNALVNDLLILDDSALRVYHLRTTAAAYYPQWQNQAQNTSTGDFENISVGEGKTANLSAQWMNDESIHSCILETNETGDELNYTDGTYDSPMFINSSADVWRQVEFNWTNKLISTATENITINWSMHCNDSAGLWNKTNYLRFNATAVGASCNGSNLNITNLVYTTATNVTINITGAGTTYCEIYMPYLTPNTTFKECNYKANNISRIFVKNYSLSYCVVNLTTVTITDGAYITVEADIRYTARLPANIPAPVAAAVVLTILIIYTVNTYRKSGGW